jgi:hypothetical protein
MVRSEMTNPCEFRDPGVPRMSESSKASCRTQARVPCRARVRHGRLEREKALGCLFGRGVKV